MTITSRLLALCCTLASLTAADLYMTPEGSGAKDGRSWSDALAYDASPSSLQDAWNRLSPGDTCHLGVGEYAARPVILTADGAGEIGRRTLRGEVKDGKRPVFTGTWGKNDKADGFVLFQIAAGSTWWAIENLGVRNCRTVIETQAPGNVAHGRLANLALEGVRDGIVIAGGASAPKPESGSHDITISDCSVVGYTKRGYRFSDGCFDIRIDRCLADAGGKEWATEAFHMGFAIAGGAAGSGIFDHDFTFTDCVSRNNYWDAGADRYWQGDGFCNEGSTYNLTYIGCAAYDNGDGGWDDKSANPLLIGCVALRNKKNFRFWAEDPGVLLVHCVGASALKRGGNSEATGIWIGGKARATRCSFVGNEHSIVINDFNETAESRARMGAELQDCIVTLSEAQQAGLLAFAGTKATGCAFWRPEGQTGEALGYTSPQTAKALSEAGTAFDSTTEPMKGYSSTWRGEDLLAGARVRQPLRPTVGGLLPATTIHVFQGKRPVGWYLSGWKGAEMGELAGAGPEGRTVLALSASGDGGASYQTKRVGISLADRAPAEWSLCFALKAGAAADLGVKAISLALTDGTKEVPVRATGGAAWQEVRLPLKDFLTGATRGLDDFSGFAIRTGRLAQPILIDRVRLEPVQ